MKTKLELLSALMVAALMASGSVMAQSVPVPASSADSGRRAVVAVTQPNMSNYATKTEVNNAYNLANTANNTANTAQYYGYNAYTNQSGAFGSPWARQFIGQQKGMCSGPLGCGYVYIDGNGYTYYHMPPYTGGWTGMGYTSGSKCISASGVVGGNYYWGFEACPTAFDYYGRPQAWVMNYASSYDQPTAN